MVFTEILEGWEHVILEIPEFDDLWIGITEQDARSALETTLREWAETHPNWISPSLPQTGVTLTDLSFCWIGGSLFLEYNCSDLECETCIDGQKHEPRFDVKLIRRNIHTKF